jgi:hypothetical protein
MFERCIRDQYADTRRSLLENPNDGFEHGDSKVAHRPEIERTVGSL